MKPGIVDDVRKIIVLRANGLGDFMFALPALHSLRAAYLEAEIVLLGLPWHKLFLAGRPSPVDRVIPVPPAAGIREGPGLREDAGKTEDFFRSLLKERFDLAIQLHGGGRFSNPFIRRAGARLTVGLRTPDSEAPDRWVPYIYFQSEIVRYLEVVGLVGATPVTLTPSVTLLEQDKAESAALATGMDGPLVVLAPGAGDGRRRWPPEKFAAVGDRLVREGAGVAVIGVENERDAVERVVAAMDAGAENLCGRLSIGGLAGLLSRAALVVGNDSGPIHLANAVGTPTVGIYWCGNLITAGSPARTLHRPVLSWRLECPVCGVNCIHSGCDHHDSFVADVSVEEVYGQAIDLLARASRSVRERGRLPRL